MLQRIQTIYLLLAFTCAVLLLVFPLFSMTAISNELANEIAVSAEFGPNGMLFNGDIDSSLESQAQYQAFGQLADNPQSGKFPVYLTYIFMGLLTLATIFLYKNRKRQIFLCRLTLILHVLVLIGVYAFYYLGTAAIKEALPLTADLTITFALEAGFYLLLCTIPFLFLALRGMKNDENLVKSLDRLR